MNLEELLMTGIINDNPDKKRNNYKNLEMWITICIFGALLLAMSFYLCFVTGDFENEELINNSFNKRQTVLTKENTRGRIFDARGNILAETVKDAEGNEVRVYPYGNLFSHAIGYSTKGKMGVEAIANYYLINSHIPVSQKAENDLMGLKNPGNDVYTTFDIDLQQIASDALGAFKGAIIVTNVKTGEILAMVSKPDFDPNTIDMAWEGYVKDNNSSVLLNRVTQGLYPPGSVFKIVTALEYYREHPQDYLDYKYTCQGHIVKEDIDIRCYHGTVHGNVDYKSSFAKSCNCSFTNMGLNLDKNKYGLTAAQLLFNKKLPIDYENSISTLHVDSTLSDSDMAQISFGQGKVSVTPILINMITCGIANSGVMMKPRALVESKDPNGNTIKTWDSEELQRICTEKEAEVLRENMEAVVLEGNGTKLKNDLYTVAGKTGSADFSREITDTHAWFTGFAPVENPEIAVTVIVEKVGTGGEYAIPFAKRIFDCYFNNN